LEDCTLGIERNGRLLFAATLLNGLAEGLWRYILPIYIADLGAAPAQVGLVLSLSSLSMLITYLPVGILSDRVSRRTLLISSRVVMAAGAAAMALAGEWRGIIPGLGLFYAGWFSYPVISGYLARLYRRRHPAAAFTTVFAGYSIGLVTTPAIGGLIAARRGMPFTLDLSAGLLLLSAIPVFFLDPQRPSSPTPMSAYRELFSNRLLRRFMLYVASLGTLLYAGQVLAPNFLQERAGFGVAKIGSLGTAASAGTAVFNFILGRARPRHALRLVLLGMTLAMLILITAPQTPLVWAAYLLFGLVGTTSFLTGGMMAPLVPERTTGLAYAIQGLTLVLSLILGPAAAGLLFDISPYLPFVMVALCLMVFMVWTRRMPLHFTDAPGTVTEADSHSTSGS
jgi:ENTS family enterobactin (siderophore) exporter